MAIYLRCPKCKKDNRLAHKHCLKCNTLLGSKYQVRIKSTSTGKWKSTMVDSLSVARRIEVMFKVQALEEELLGKNHDTPQGIQQILSGIAHLSPQTRKHTPNLIRRVYNWHIEHGLWHQENPAKNLKVPKLDNRVSTILSREELGVLVNYL